ncbi:hypothetical protein GSY69_11275 [Brevibacterium sp. 5221]|uniref:Uncharacterized protein n=1 Tax=Brevibacterium rongguiense TaxID=2695267 RepID=A0A6N9H920_9MICO|nr:MULTISPECIES: HGxxPAAW family protein [Brevibacterium]MYM20529.1 hypothetical protein [Brevibacterium rongguiense]WAL40880.1 hypothetical protein BRM1_03150 [Brevibacterium sp. BRM-1]
MSALVARNGAPDLDKSTIDYEAIQDPGHGHSIAGWTGSGLVFLGVIIGTIGNVLFSWPMFFVGAGIVVLGPIAFLILNACGLGAKPHHNHLPPR